MTTIDSSFYLSTKSRDVKTGQSTLGKDDFLKILLTQLQNQDPMNPMQDKEFISQMATFSSLEQMTNMGKSMDAFVKMQSTNQIFQYSHLIGKQIDWTKSEVLDGQEEPIITSGKGTVISVKQQGSNVLLELEDGTYVNSTDVKGVSKEKLNTLEEAVVRSEESGS
ncbi:flagellar hook assembly protein FlgD [Bacillus sp. HMF5848]|uniref:flagellar hook assembly protein FlgD n=1 Tax=Bacillus sp. HMF5848 TaxID=2495421 RepID=UPI000F7B8D6D|nr:flagellar hook assembly protein FlgD [Bacillus sp. HMF5848]RSK27032.1 flagellar hook assembly protein FlgD [Bacillus sp. HMF5848]